MPQADGPRLQRVRWRSGTVFRVTGEPYEIGMRRRFAVFAVGMIGIIQTADRGTTTAAALIREAENLAYFEGFGPARTLLERAVRTASRLGDVPDRKSVV